MEAPNATGFRTLAELEAAAAARTDPATWAYVQGGAGAERTVRANVSAFDRWWLRPRALTGLSSIDLSTRFLGQDVGAPFFLAPTAYHGALTPDGELATARAAAREAVLATYSTLSSRSLEAIAEAAGAGPRWFQLYLQPEWPESRRLIERAEAAGYSAIVLTVNVPVFGGRDRQAGLGFAIDRPPPIGNGPEIVAPFRVPEFQGPRIALPPPSGAETSVLDRVVAATRLPVLVKGILHEEDATRCLEHGARGIVVSNHGGRQLDGAPPALELLPRIVAAVGGRAEVYVDGGVRRGSDIVVALALGARGVGLGRPVLWALAEGGEAGLGHYLALLKVDLAIALALTGRGTPSAVDASVIEPAR